MGRAWALGSQDKGSESQEDMGGRCQSPGMAGTPLCGMGQAKQPLGIEHKVALRRARLDVVEVFRGSGGLVCCPAF